MFNDWRNICLEGCEHWELVLPNWMRDGAPLAYFKLNSNQRPHKPFLGIYFKVKYKLVFWKLFSFFSSILYHSLSAAGNEH